MATSDVSGVSRTPFTRGSRQGKKHRHAYNSYVAHQRQENYYSRKKAKTKFKRTLRYEARMQGEVDSNDKSSLLAQTLERGASAIEDEYERNLALSYGSPSESIATTSHIAPRKKRRRESVQQDAVVELAQAESTSLPRKKRKKGLASEKGHKVQEPSPKGEHRKSQKEDLAKDRKLQKEELPKDSSQKQWNHRTNVAAKRPDRFSKDLKKFHETREAAEKERQRRYDEEWARKRQRKQTAKGRAMKGQQLSQRNARGQPKMQGFLESIAAKLAQEQQPKR